MASHLADVTLLDAGSDSRLSAPAFLPGDFSATEPIAAPGQRRTRRARGIATAVLIATPFWALVALIACLLL